MAEILSLERGAATEVLCIFIASDCAAAACGTAAIAAKPLPARVER